MLSNIITQFLVSFVAASVTIQLTSAASRASFGETCSKELRCDSRKFLSCSSSEICDCLIKDSMVYDEDFGKCVTLAGERCLMTTVEGERSWSDELPCVSGANCTSGVCTCVPSYFDVSNGTCSVKKGSGGDCTSDQMCDSSKFLTCGADQRCACHEALGLILEGNECKLLAGNTCSTESGAKCISGAICDHSQCKCLPNNFQSQNGTCLAKGNKGDSCNSDSECFQIISNRSTFLVCRDGSCQCDPASSTDEQSICKRQLGHLCTQNDCIQGANCTDGTCQCVKATHFQTETQTCQLRASHGDTCSQDGNCLNSLQCGPARKCVCPVGMSFSATSKRCVQSAGSSCANRYGDDMKECVPNSKCREIYISGSGYEYFCYCEDQFTNASNTDGLCNAMHGTACDGDTFGPFTSKQCVPGQVCREGRCTCRYKNHQVYDSNLKKCRSSIRGPCNVTSDCLGGGVECSEEGGVHKCLCKQGYVQLGSECRVTFGGKCNPNGAANHEKCDSLGGLECTSRGICSCPELQVYDEMKMSCMGLEDAKCTPSQNNKDGFCGFGTFCKPLRGDPNSGFCGHDNADIPSPFNG